MILSYCDGAGHQGSRENPILYKGTELYFRGNNITQAQLLSLEQKAEIFSSAQEIIVSGASAGGLASLIWTNYIAERASTGSVYAIPDSGVFLD